jgi:hypothetical protein
MYRYVLCRCWRRWSSYRHAAVRAIAAVVREWCSFRNHAARVIGRCACRCWSCGGTRISVDVMCCVLLRVCVCVWVHVFSSPSRICRRSLSKWRWHVTWRLRRVKEAATAAALVGQQWRERWREEREKAELEAAARRQQAAAREEQAAREASWRQEQARVQQQHRAWLAEVGLAEQQQQQQEGQQQGQEGQGQGHHSASGRSDYSLDIFMRKFRDDQQQKQEEDKERDQQPGQAQWQTSASGDLTCGR